MKQLSNIKFLDQFCNVHINSIERLNACQEKIHQFVFLQKMRDCTWKVSDCEKLVAPPVWNN